MRLRGNNWNGYIYDSEHGIDNKINFNAHKIIHRQKVSYICNYIHSSIPGLYGLHFSMKY